MKTMTKSDVKYIQSLAHKKHRQEEGVFVVEGVKMVDELLHDFPERIVRIYATENWIITRKEIVKKHILFDSIDDLTLAKISFLQTPNEVVALVSLPTKPSHVAVNEGITLVLDQIQDPGNLGTIIRTADWFGVKQIICSSETSDAFAPKVVQSAMGSLMRLDIRHLELEEFFNAFDGIPIYTAELNGDAVFNITFKQPLILVIGNESKGVSGNISKLATRKIKIPRIGQAESLNAGIATGIILSQITR